jgi:hypothetical protein
MDFDDKETAEAALSDMEEAGGKHNGDLIATDVDDLDADE